MLDIRPIIIIIGKMIGKKLGGKDYYYPKNMPKRNKIRLRYFGLGFESVVIICPGIFEEVSSSSW